MALLMTAALPSFGGAHVRAQSREVDLSLMRSAGWTRADGAPALSIAMAQSSDGFLWIASNDGLVRFDGLSFELIDGDFEPRDLCCLREIFIDRDGAIWVGSGTGRVGVYRGGRLEPVKTPDLDGEIVGIRQTPDGALWFGVGQIGRPLWRFYQGRWTSLSPSPTRDELINMVVAEDGALWLSYGKTILRRAPGSGQFEQTFAPLARGSRLVIDPEGAIWDITSGLGRRLSGPAGAWPAMPSPPVRWDDESGPQSLVFDRRGNLFGTGRVLGVTYGLSGPSSNSAGRAVYEPMEPLRLVSPSTASVFVDRQGAVWVGSRVGLNRLTQPTFAPEPSMTAVASFGDVLFTSSAGVLYVGQRDAVYRIPARGRPERMLSVDTEPEAICEGPGGALWIAIGDRFVQLRDGRRTDFPRPEAETGIYECGVDPSGRFWATASGSGMYWLDGQTWRSVEPPSGQPEFQPTILARDLLGRPWILSQPHTLTRLDGGLRETVAIDPEVLGDVRSLHTTSLGIIVAGRRGIGLLSGDRVLPMNPASGETLANASGWVETAQGDTWITRAAGVVRVRTADVIRAFQEPDFTLPSRLFGFEDGLIEGPHSQTWRSMAAGGDGRIWLSTLAGVISVDPAALSPNSQPPGVVITGLSVGDTRIRDPGVVRLRAGASDITLGFSALNLSLPEGVKVLYRLEGHDADWVDPGRRRQAFYTNLEPGTYRFRVIAANEDGVWNRVGDTTTITIPPTFIQSIWFKFLVAIALIGLGWMLYSLRIRQIEAGLLTRFQARTAERERIARELHDTLLQGFQGLMLRFQAVANRLDAQDPLRPTVEQALDRAEAVMAEGRSRVRDLRSEVATGDLSEALADLASGVSDDGGPPVELVVEGAVQPTPHAVTQELLRIADEALRNAGAHAGASQISVLLSFGRQELRLVMSDDGVGLPEDVRRTGARSGHYGLTGMRERAESLGGRFEILTREGGGTEVVVRVPARAAYLGAASSWPSLRRLAFWHRPVA